MTQQSGSRNNKLNATLGTQSGQAGVSGTVQEVTEQAKDKAGQVAQQAGQQVTSRLTVQKDRAAEGLTGVAQAIRQTGQHLREQDQAGFTDYIDSAATQVERISGYIRGKEIGDMVDDVERFARRQPALFVGGAFLLGALGVRFLKSSRQQLQSSNEYPMARRQDYAYGPGTYSQSYEREVGGTSGYGATGGMTGASYGTGTTGTTASYGTGTTGTTGATRTTGTTGADTIETTGTGTPRRRDTEEL